MNRTRVDHTVQTKPSTITYKLIKIGDTAPLPQIITPLIIPSSPATNKLTQVTQQSMRPTIPPNKIASEPSPIPSNDSQLGATAAPPIYIPGTPPQTNNTTQIFGGPAPRIYTKNKKLNSQKTRRATLRRTATIVCHQEIQTRQKRNLNTDEVFNFFTTQPITTTPIEEPKDHIPIKPLTPKLAVHLEDDDQLHLSQTPLNLYLKEEKKSQELFKTTAQGQLQPISTHNPTTHDEIRLTRTTTSKS